MAFAHPEILWGLWGLAIPVIIHLLNFRRFRRVAFSQVAFLQALQRESRSRQAIRHWLVLAMRLLAVAGLVLAFAQPFIPANDAKSGESNGSVVALYIDNSASMDAIGEEGALLQVSIEKAIRVVESYKETDRFFVQTNSFTPRDSRLLTREEALNRLTEIKSSTTARHITEVMQRAEGHLMQVQGRNRRAYLFSDLQQSSHDLSQKKFQPDTSIHHHFVPSFAAEAINAWVDSVWFDTPTRLAQQKAQLHVRIGHNSPAGVSDLPLELRIDGARAAIGTYNLVPGMPTDTVLRFTHGPGGKKQAQVSIEDAPIQFDDDFYFGFEVTSSIQVVHFTEQPKGVVARSIRQVFETSSATNTFETSATFSLDLLKQSDFVLVSGWPAPSTGMAEALRGFVSNGGSCLWIPDSSAVESLETQMRSALGFGSDGTWLETPGGRVGQIATEHPIFAGVFRKIPRALDLPRLNRVLSRTPMAREEILVQSEQGSPFISRVGIDKGSAYMLGSTIHEEHSNFTRHALFVPLMLRMAERARYTPVLACALGEGRSLDIPGDLGPTQSLTLQSAGNDVQVWQPEVRKQMTSNGLTLPAGLESPGNYSLHQGDSLLHWIGVNANRMESLSNVYDVPTWQTMCENSGWSHTSILEADTEAMATVTKQLKEGTPLWKVALLAALLALFIETILLRLWYQKSS